MIITESWLQKHLDTSITRYSADYYRKEQAPRITCMSGASLSVQASQYHYCTPSSNMGPYRNVEVGFLTASTELPEWFPGDYENDVAAFVPVQDVVAYINTQGGVKE